MIEQYFVSNAANGSHENPLDNSTAICKEPRDDAMHIFRNPTPSKSPFLEPFLRHHEVLWEFSCIDEAEPDLPWAGVVFGMFISNVWYWCTDQASVNYAKV